jgi:hypothetical protein
MRLNQVNFTGILPRVPRLTLILVATVGALLVAGSARADRVFLDVDTPHSGDTVSEPIGLVEVRGWVGTQARGKHDVLILLDRSGSTFASSGIDVDGDGVIGHNYSPRPPPEIVTWTSDFGDTIVSAETLAARRLVERTDPTTTRMGIISFGGNAKVEAPLGSSRAQLLAALDALPPRPNEYGTYMYGALDTAIKTFESAPPEPGVTRQRDILLLSDGEPTAPPSPENAAQDTAVHAARNAARANARIYAFALGPVAARHREQFDEIVRANGGELLVLDSPGEVVDFAPYTSFTAIARMRVENATTGQPGRAVRLFPDGSFDGFAPLADGKNELRFVATSEAGAELTTSRFVTYLKTAPNPERLEQLKKTLQIRAIETELAERIRAKREERLKKSLEITPEMPRK